ncbi:MAG: phage major capsid protein [Nitrospira sp.]|nr:MAG: phage major capsid protein [Nitrospira sp.]
MGGRSMDLLTRGKIERIGTLARDVERGLAGEDAPIDADGYLGLSRRDIEKYSMLKAIGWKVAEITKRLHGSSGPNLDGVEGECHKALVKKRGEPVHQGTIYVPADVLYHQRDLTAANAGSGGYTVGTSIGSFIEMVKNKSVTAAMGVQRVGNQRESLAWAKQTGGPVITWQANEATQAAESTPTFVQATASPKTAIALHDLSRQSVLNISPAGEQLFRGGLADGVALAGDQAVLVGTGASGQPLGIVNTAGIGSVTGTSMDYADIVEFQTDVSDGNAVLNPSTLGYVTTPTIAALLKSRQRFTGSDSALWKGSVHEGEIEGCRAMSSKQMPTATMLFGDWSTVIVVEWGVLAIEVNPFTDFKAGIIGIRAVWSLDVIVTHPGAFSLATSIT